MCTIAPDQLVDLVCAVQSRNPGIELEIIDSSAAKLEERLIEGDLEVAIYCPAANQKDERLHYMPLFREQFLVVLPAEHPLAAKNGIRPGDLNGVRYLNRINCEFNGYAGALWKEHGLTCETAYRSERDDWILAMVASGLGFGFMPGSCVSHPRVVGRPMIDPEFWREVSLVTVRGTAALARRRRARARGDALALARPDGACRRDRAGGRRGTCRKPVGQATRSPARARQAPPGSPPRRSPDRRP